jgi:predicted Zn-dependent protease
MVSAVVGSVSTYVKRIEGLDANGEGDAKAVREMLRTRGLTAGRIADIRRLLEQAQAGVEPQEKDEAPVTAAELEKARLAQREAVSDLRDWFNDWGTTLRPRFGPRPQVQLGLVVLKGRGSAAKEGGEA